MKKITMVVMVLLTSLIFSSGCAKKKKFTLPELQYAVIEAPIEANMISSGTVVTTSKVKWTFPLVHFDFNSTELFRKFLDILEGVSDYIVANKGTTIISGHCDSRGTTAYNLALGEGRAARVKGYLVSLGVPEKNIKTISYGKEILLCVEDTEDCHAKNRRVGIEFLWPE